MHEHISGLCRNPIAADRAAHWRGTGGRRSTGLSHLVVLEVLDEMGLKPVVLSGTSIGAIIGAAYASGMSGRDIRAYMLEMLGDRAEVVRRLLKARVGRFSQLLRQGLTNPVLLDGEMVLDAFLPSSVPADFAQLRIPLSIAAADFHSGEEVIFSEGPLMPAIAASMAIPGVCARSPSAHACWWMAAR